MTDQMTSSHFSLQSIIRPNIASLKPYRCARDDYDEGVLLDANENSLGSALAAPSLIGDTSSALSAENGLDLHSLSLHRYPSPLHIPIKQNLCDYRNQSDPSLPSLSPSNVFLGVGSDEVLDLLFRITCKPGDTEDQGDRVIVTPPTYGMYTVCARVNDVGVISVPLNVTAGAFTPDYEMIIQAIETSPPTRPVKLVMFCSPGNPTGTTVSLDLIQTLLSDPRYKGLVVVDEAYIDFAGQDQSALQLLRKGYQNLVVVQTLSKGFGLAGIRLGIAYGSEELIQVLNNTKAPYTISSPTASLAYAATLPQALNQTHANLSQIRSNRDWLKVELQKITGMGQILGKTEANFILIQVLSSSGDGPDSSRAKKVYQHMAGLQKEEAIVVRFRGEEFGCDGCLRITVGTMDECKKVIERLRTTLEIIT